MCYFFLCYWLCRGCVMLLALCSHTACANGLVGVRVRNLIANRLIPCYIAIECRNVLCMWNDIRVGGGICVSKASTALRQCFCDCVCVLVLCAYAVL